MAWSVKDKWIYITSFKDAKDFWYLIKIKQLRKVRRPVMRQNAEDKYSNKIVRI